MSLLDILHHNACHRVSQRAHLQILLRLAQLGSLLLSVHCTPLLALQLPLQVFDAALQLDAFEEADLQNDSLSRHCGRVQATGQTVCVARQPEGSQPSSTLSI